MVYLINIFFAVGLNLLAVTAWIDGVPEIPDENHQVIIEGTVTKVTCRKGKSAQHIEYGENQRFELAVFSIKEFKCDESRNKWRNRKFIAYFTDHGELYSPYRVVINGIEVYGEEQFVAGKLKSLILFTILAAVSNIFWLYYFFIYKKKSNKTL